MTSQSDFDILTRQVNEMRARDVTQVRIDGPGIDRPTFQGIEFDFIPSLGNPHTKSERVWIFDPNAKVGPHTGIEFFEALVGRPIPPVDRLVEWDATSENP